QVARLYAFRPSRSSSTFGWIPNFIMLSPKQRISHFGAFARAARPVWRQSRAAGVAKSRSLLAKNDSTAAIRAIVPSRPRGRTPRRGSFRDSLIGEVLSGGVVGAALDQASARSRSVAPSRRRRDPRKGRQR